MTYRIIVYLFIVTILSTHISAQSSHKSDVQLGIELGAVQADLIGDGILWRPFLKYNLNKRFPESLLNLRARFAPEFLYLQEKVSGLKMALQLDYMFNLFNNPVSLGISGRRDFYSLSNNDQSLDELQMQLKYKISIDKKWSFSFFDQAVWRSLETVYKNSIILNRPEFTVDYYKNGWQGSAGFFYENSDFRFHGLDSSGTTSNLRMGPQLKIVYQRLFIFNLVYKYSMKIKRYKADHQISLIAGKYIKKNISLFVFIYYLLKNQAADQNTLSVFNRLTSTNSISAKLTIELNDKTQVYTKMSYEDQNLAKFNNLISTWQAVVGLKRKF